MSGVRIQMMLNPELPDDAVVLEWLESLPTTNTGRHRVKKFLVPMLVSAIHARNGKPRTVKRRAAKKKTTPPADSQVSMSTDSIEVKDRDVAEKARIENESADDFPSLDQLDFGAGEDGADQSIHG